MVNFHKLILIFFMTIYLETEEAKVIYAIFKNKEEQKLLDRAIREAKDKGWYRRLMVIKLSSQGKLIRHLQKEFGLCEATIRSYIHSYNQGGLDELRPRKPTGRPAKIANWSKRDWEKVLENPPSYYKRLNSYSNVWTLELMTKYLMEYHQTKVCISSVYNSLNRSKKRKIKVINDTAEIGNYQ